MQDIKPLSDLISMDINSIRKELFKLYGLIDLFSTPYQQLSGYLDCKNFVGR